MADTNKVLGSIDAMNTFIENFPMSILDIRTGKTYTSVFEFIIDVLNSCGVDTNEIINFLLNKIYGVEASINGGIENIYERIKNGDFEMNPQNPFVEGLEYSIKGILMGLLSSVFSCSAIPVIPNKMFDGPDGERFPDKDANSPLFKDLQDKVFENVLFKIPVSAIDPMGLLQISPTSSEGRLYYAIGGKDRYYRKQYITETYYREEYVTIPENTEKKLKDYSEEPLYKKQIPVYIKGNNGEYKFCVIDDDESLGIDISVKVTYSPFGGKNVLTEEFLIPKNIKESDKVIIIPKNENGTTVIHSIKINNEIEFGDYNGNWIYLSAKESNPVIEEWEKAGATSLLNVSWGQENNEKKWTETYKTIEKSEVSIVEKINVPETKSVLTYVEIEYSEIPSEIRDSENGILRVDFVPTEDIEDNAEYIVCFNDLNPNTLYQTYDMNAFLWYVLHKGTKIPQVEYNHMMWDSRISARKNNIIRDTSAKWNAWYASKSDYSSEFKYENNLITNSSPLFPILQLEQQGVSKSWLKVHIPSQRYLMPKKREAIISKSDDVPKRAFNSSIYKFNWDYLENIQILNPKLLLVGMCESLLGFALSTAASTNISITKKIIEGKLAKAIKSVIEANDMEVEDCYLEFSNDEVNTLMEEMLLSRYNATHYGGDTATVRVHDVKNYINMLDNVNKNVTVAGNTSEIKKLVTEVTGNPSTEGSIKYGLQISTDGNLIEKLLWAISMPILQSIFTPQVLLLLIINYELMGLTKLSDFANNDFGLILNLLMNKIFGLVKSIILFIKDKIIELLLTFLIEKILPLLIKYELILLMENLVAWIELLKAAISCLPMLKFKRNKITGTIDEVDYADIINEQNIPELVNPC